ncbi:MAG: hypothetical protein R2860_01405 [Desulfobacterales bacterium]
MGRKYGQGRDLDPGNFISAGATNDGVGNNPIYCVAAAYQPVQYTICIISALNNPLRLVYGTVTIAIRYLKYFVSAYPLGTVIHMALTSLKYDKFVYVPVSAPHLRHNITPYRRQWSTRKLPKLLSLVKWITKYFYNNRVQRT